MSQVKFIQLGTTVEPKKNYIVDGKNEYTTDLQSAINSYPGAVIFTTFIKSATGKPKNEIYANGLLYSAGGSGSGSVYYGTDQVVDGLISNWSNSHPGEEPERGSIYIYTPNSKTTGEDIANRTAYYFECTEGQESQGKWIAFTGNVNAENVWFPNGVQRTEIWGAATTGNAIPTAECTGFNLKNLLENYLVKETFVPSYITRQNNTIADFTGQLQTNPTIEVNSYIILNSAATGTYHYYPTVEKTDNCITSGTKTFGPQTINNKVGYKKSKTDTAYTAGNKVGETVSIDVTVDDSITQGDGNVTITDNGTQVVSKNYTAGTTDVTGTWNINTKSLGSKKATLTATNSARCAATYTKADEEIESINIPGISTIYPVTNKGNIPSSKEFGQNAQPNGISADVYRIPSSGSFATSMSFTACPTTSTTYTVYLPIKSNMIKNGTINSSIQELAKFSGMTGNEITFTGYINGTNPTSGTARYTLSYPSSYLTLNSIKPQGDVELTENTHYEINDGGTQHGVSYKKIIIRLDYKYSNQTNLPVTFKFSKVTTN